VQALPSSQSAATAQLQATEVNTHLCVVVLQVSTVQVRAPSEQSPFTVQQPAIGVALHVFVAVSHESAVHTSESLQSPSVKQQVAMGACAHW
jgi:hypothetical protein